VSRPGRQSRHNLKYWRGESWLGFGCAAHTTWDGIRWRNLSGTGEYVARVLAGESARVDVQVLSRQERLEEALFMGLRLTDGLDLTSIREAHGVDVLDRYGEALRRFVEAGLVVEQPGSRLALTRSGMLVANEIMMVFIGDTVR
jgi:oxygen-independent coproporphyrinogen III oxidase